MCCGQYVPRVSGRARTRLPQLRSKKFEVDIPGNSYGIEAGTYYLEEIADHVGISYHHVRHLFKKHRQMSLKQFLANLRINQMVAQMIGLPPEKTHNTIQKYGNTTAASIPMCMHEAIELGKIKPGNLVCLVAFGAGLTWGSVFLRY